jgi:hypothetical protein
MVRSGRMEAALLPSAESGGRIINLVCENTNYTAQITVNTKTNSVIILHPDGDSEDWVDGRVSTSRGITKKQYVSATDNVIKFGSESRLGIDVVRSDWVIDSAGKLTRESLRMQCRPGTLKKVF